MGVDRMAQLRWLLITIIIFTVGNVNMSFIQQSGNLVQSAATNILGKTRSYRRLLKKKIVKKSRSTKEIQSSINIKTAVIAKKEIFNIVVYDSKSGESVYEERVNANPNFADKGIAYTHLDSGNYRYLINQDGFVVNAGAFTIK